MSNDPAYYLAQRARELYALSPRATMRELLRVCCIRGVAVEWDAELDCEGWFINQPRPLIVLKRRHCPWVLCHEIFHAWITMHSKTLSHLAWMRHAPTFAARAVAS